MKMFKMKYIVISCVVILLGFCFEDAVGVDCRSYGRQTGSCVDISRCPPLLALILSSKKTPEHIRMLQKLTCVTQIDNKKDPVVCCPINEIVSETYIPDPGTYFATSTTERSTTALPVLVVTPWDRDRDRATRRTTTTTPYSVGNTDRRRIPGLANLRPSATTKKPAGSPVSPAEQILLKRKFERIMPTLANCSQSDVVGGRIIGGKDAEHGQYPWMARLGYRNVNTGKVEYYCGGVIINKRYILTAAHCTYGYDDSFQLVHVRLGEHNTKELTDCSTELNSCSIPENVGVEKVITHPEYDTVTKHNDIALIRVARDIGFQTYFIKPVCLPYFKEYGIEEPSSFESLTGIVAGWGRTNWTRSEGSAILQHVHLPIVATDKCVRDFRNRVKISPEQFCAGGSGGSEDEKAGSYRDSCGGDSGGPLMADTVIGRRGPIQIKKKFQYGIVSFGPVKCGIGIPGVYTRVTQYLTWILRSVEP